MSKTANTACNQSGEIPAAFTAAVPASSLPAHVASVGEPERQSTCKAERANGVSAPSQPVEQTNAIVVRSAGARPTITAGEPNGSDPNGKLCRFCRQPLPIKHGPTRQFCSSSCRRRAGRCRKRKPLGHRVCSVCGAMLKNRQTLFCSKSCQRKTHGTTARRLAGVNPNRQPMQCQWCHAPFTSRRAFQKHCSERCRGAAMDHRRREQLGYGKADYRPTAATIQKIAHNLRAAKLRGNQ
jgi:predicted nucleic acid-binding Zn ribbon protein